jgi:hypothetical protein
MHRSLRKPHFLSCPYPHSRNVLELIEFFEEEDRFYLVFEKMRGGKQGFLVGGRNAGDISTWVLMGWRFRTTRKDLSEGETQKDPLL